VSINHPEEFYYGQSADLQQISVNLEKGSWQILLAQGGDRSTVFESDRHA
jgi:hypothetical protein